MIPALGYEDIPEVCPYCGRAVRRHIRRIYYTGGDGDLRTVWTWFRGSEYYCGTFLGIARTWRYSVEEVKCQ